MNCGTGAKAGGFRVVSWLVACSSFLVYKLIAEGCLPQYHMARWFRVP